MKLLFPKQNYNVLSPSSYTHIPVRDSYIYPGSVCLFCCRKICRPILGIYKSLTDTGCGNWEWGLQDYINRIFDAVCSQFLGHPPLRAFKAYTVDYRCFGEDCNVKTKQGYPGALQKMHCNSGLFEKERKTRGSESACPNSFWGWVGGILLHRLLTEPQPTKKTGFG